jgi:hypothetical protein
MTPPAFAGAAALSLAEAIRRALKRRDLRRQKREAHYG